MSRVGIFGGTFDPIHNGHLITAQSVKEIRELEKIIFIPAYISPHKQHAKASNAQHRLNMLKLAMDEIPFFECSDFEIKQHTISYTIDTLVHLSEKNPGKEFVLIMGADGLASFHKWKNSDQIIRYYHRYVYPREGTDPGKLPNMENATLVEAPVIGISSSFIRKAIREGKDVRYFLPAPVWKYIQEMNFYRKA